MGMCVFQLEQKYVTCNVQEVGGQHEKMSFFHIASGPILSIQIYLKTCLYGPYKFSLKKNDPFLTYEPPKVSIFL